MEKWQRDLYGIPDPPPLWQPTYQAQKFVVGVNQKPNPISPQLLVTKETAVYLAGLYQASVVEKPFVDDGAEKSNAIIYFLRFGGVFDIPAGSLAYYYKPAESASAIATVENPELAVTECRAAINAARLDYLHLPRETK